MILHGWNKSDKLFLYLQNENDDASTIINELKNINISQLKTDDLKLFG